MDAAKDVAITLNITRKNVRRLLDCYRVTDGKGFKLKHHDPADTAGRLLSKDQASHLLQTGVIRLAELQQKLYAQNSWSMLCAFQAMDAAGKDGTIKHVMSGVNPQGVQVTSFKAPGPEELAHDFLWRCVRVLPERGRIGIFNRSHYEEVLVVRVHPEILEKQRLPKELVGKKIWDERLEEIAGFEYYLARQGTVVLKFFLNVSKEEQKRRFLERLDEPDKNWKFSAGDLAERGFWDQYQAAYQEAIVATAAPHAPWYVVPADNKWFTRLVVVAAMIEALDGLDLKLPALGEEQTAALKAARAKLEAE
ncbi:MAG TPA: polyphosphate kinase 2 family protein [Acetobacteraceae bacterium]|jgi:PPK2 family polyphosphate:nucleotide phosphotransferase|nr:polyphosphate kinase 2 family protein [Acetobacteraceae bacterium]